MYAVNEKISYRQMKRLLVFDLFSIGTLVIPRLVVSQTGYDGIPALFLGLLLAICYAVIMLFFISQIGGTVYRYAQDSVGKVFSFVIGALYIFKLFFSCVVMVQLFSTVINLTLLSETTKYWVIIPMILVSGYATYKGGEVRARLAELLYYIVLVPIFVMLILGLKDVDLANLTPIFSSGMKQTVYGSYLVFMVFNVIEFILFIKPYIREEKTKQIELRKTFLNTLMAILTAFVFFLLFFILTVGILGMTGANQSMWSTVNIFQIIEVPGSLLNRQDSLIIGLWLLSTFTLISGFIFYLSIILKEMFTVYHKNSVLPLILVMLILCSMIPIQQEELLTYYLEYMKRIGIPQSLIIPIVLIIVNKCRRKKKLKHVKSASLIIGLLIVPLFLTGCNGHVEIEDRDFVQVIGLDYEDGNVDAYYILPDLGSMTEQGKSEEPNKLIRKFQGQDYIAIEEQYKLQSEKQLDYSHLKAIILGKEFAGNKDKMKSFLDYVESNYQLSKKTLVFLADDTAKTIIDMNGNVENGVGSYLERLYQNNLGNSQKKEIFLAGLLQVKNNMDQCMFIPILDLSDDRIFLNGEAVFYQGTVMLKLNAEESIITDLISGYGENARLFTNLSDDSSDESKDFVIKVSQIQKSFEFEMDGQTPRLILNLTAAGSLEKGMEDQESLTYAQKAKVYKEVEETLDEQVKDRIYNQFDTIMKNQNVDYMNLYRTVRYKNRKIYQKYKGRQLDFIKDLEFDIHVAIDILD